MKTALILAGMLLLGSMNLTATAPDSTYRKALENDTRTEDDFSRDRTSKPEDILAFAGVKPGMTVLDLFAGNGYYSEILSRVVGPDGKVYLHNNKAYMDFVKKNLESRLAGNRLANVVKHVRESEEMDLPEEGFDVIFMVMAFHDIFYKDKGWNVDGEKLMKQIHAALKPGGVVLLIDHAAVDGTRDQAAQKLHRIDESFTKAEMKRHGFKLEKESKILRNEKDDRKVIVFDPKIRRKTDRFVHLYRKQ